MNGCFANLRMLCPCESSHLEPFLYIHIFRSASLDVLYNVWFRYLNLCFANSHMFVPLGVLTVRTSLDTCSNSQVYICYIINAIVYEPKLCKLTYVCALASPHTFNLLFTCISSQVYMNHIIDTLVYETQLCNSHLSVPLRELTLRTFLFAYIYSKVNIYHVIDTFVYEPMLCELTYVSSLASPHFEALCIQAHTYKNTYVIA